MMVFISVYGVVDGFFVSNYAGKTAFAAINLIMPFVMVLGGMGFMIGTGGTALVSKVMGEGDPERANRLFSEMISFTVIFGAVLSAVGVAVMRPVSVLLGATPEMIDDCVLYGRIVVGFTAAFMLQNVFQSFFIAAEKPKLGLAATVAAGLTNMVLDALFVGGFNWGIAGAAVATGISQCVGSIFPLIYFAAQNKSRLRLSFAMPEIKPVLASCANGSSELMSNISASIVGMLYNFQLMRLLGEDGVSAYGVMMYVQFIFTAVFFGFSTGSAPIISYHFGADNPSEVKNMLIKSVVFMEAAGAVLTAAAIAMSPLLADIFVGYDVQLKELTEHAFRIYCLHFVLAGFNIFASSFFTALNNGAVSAAISFIRTLVFQVAAVLLLPLVLGENGIWCSVLVADAGATVLSVIFLYKKRYEYGYA
ncbi:MAG: MATE family efflux transporter [Phoenicibacter congonensis]|uniref:MATE family efflux transporter n=1 Tax=Phoenicibacter congonensis TaxID=1944646 RepID=A0AA43RMD3_9ACTN|nr:MATE family efflux transporter [Phoenicibacter congonensis]